MASTRVPGRVSRFGVMASALALAALAAGCGVPVSESSATGPATQETERPDAQLAAAGAGVYQDVCSNCHGGAGLGSEWAPALTTITLDVSEVSAQVLDGNPPSMPSFAATLTDAEIEAVAAYTVQLRYSD